MRGDEVGGLTQHATLAAAGQPSDVAVGDLDEDGLLVSEGQANTVAIPLGIGAPSFAPPIRLELGQTLDELALGDLDEDGRLDIAVTEPLGNVVAVIVSVK